MYKPLADRDGVLPANFLRLYFTLCSWHSERKQQGGLECPSAGAKGLQMLG